MVLAELKISVVVVDFHGLKRIIRNQVRSTKEACGEGNGLVGKSKTGAIPDFIFCFYSVDISGNTITRLDLWIRLVLLLFILFCCSGFMARP